MFVHGSKYITRQELLFQKKRAERYCESNVKIPAVMPGYCSSLWINLFVLIGNVFVFAAMIQMARAEMQQAQHAIHTNDALNQFGSARTKHWCNLTDEEIHAKVSVHPEIQDKISLQSCQKIVTENIHSTLANYPMTKEYIPSVVRQANIIIMNYM